MKLLAFSGSLRQGSFNKKLVTVACDIAKTKGAEITHIDLSQFEMPLYNGDIEDSKGVPAAANKLSDLFKNADGVMISSPEYNYSAAGVIKNAFDWMSRIRPQQPFKNKHILLMSASPSMVGGNRGLWSLRVPLEGLGAFVYPEMFSLASAHEAFTSEGGLTDSSLFKTLGSNVDGFIEYVSKNV
ncbi:MAG: NAD(P)H-dependent oxidoreductase [Pseudomonadota bacterium]